MLEGRGGSKPVIRPRGCRPSVRDRESKGLSLATCGPQREVPAEPPPSTLVWRGRLSVAIIIFSTVMEEKLSGRVFRVPAIAISYGLLPGCNNASRQYDNTPDAQPAFDRTTLPDEDLIHELLKQAERRKQMGQHVLPGPRADSLVLCSVREKVR